MNVTEKIINDYLHYTYVPEFGDTSKLSHILSLKKTRDLSTIKEEDLIQEGVGILNTVFDKLVEENLGKRHLIPLSGGLDSRLIFCAVAERVKPEKIQVVTYGSPNSHDYDIPKKVVKKYSGVAYEQINCAKLDYSLANLIEAAKDGGQWCASPDMYINRVALNLEEDYCRWSGFLGGPVAGNNSTKKYNSPISYAQAYKRSKKLGLTAENYRPEASLVGYDKKLLDLTPFEVLALYNNAAANGIRILLPRSTEVITPFLDKQWNEFMLQLPLKYRANMYLYKKIMCRMFPEAMKVGIKDNGGLRVNEKSRLKKFVNSAKLKVHFKMAQTLKSAKFPTKGVNYLFYPEAIREIPSLQNSIREACENLQERGIVPWLNPKEILSLHLKREGEYSDALLVLLGLEVNLAVEDLQIHQKKNDIS